MPTLVHDGCVHIESNDILAHLETRYPVSALFPAGRRDEVNDLLRHEDDLHMALRTITFRFLVPSDKPPKSMEQINRYAALGSGTVGGMADDGLDRELAYWRNVHDNGISDSATCLAIDQFRKALSELDMNLNSTAYLLGDTLSVLDIAWAVYVNRLLLAGYPLERLHPNLADWFGLLSRNPAFAREFKLPATVAEQIRGHLKLLARSGQSLEQVAGL